MRFGAFTPQGWRHDLMGLPVDQHWPTILDSARAIERVGFESVWVYDHFHPVPRPTQEPVYEAWTLMAALAATTDTVRIGQMCTCNSYRPPAYLAKVAASIDAISNGRLEMGIGAGWYEHEYDGYGYPFPKPAVRLGQLDEAVQLIKRMWTEDVVEFEGEHFTLKGAMLQPKPLQEPHIPVWIAGGGEQLTLRTAARYADYTNFAGDLEAFTHKSEVLAKHCEQQGTDFDRIVRSANYNVTCEETAGDVEDRIRENLDRIGRHLPEDGREAVLGGIEANLRKTAGTPEQLVEQLRPVVDAGMSYGIAYFAEAAYDTSGLERFAREVVPEL